MGITGRRQPGDDQVLTALRAAPLDRVHLMKTLFLHWYRRDRPAEGPFHFQPYMFGPCAFDLYSALARLEAERLIAQEQPSSWSDYMLTESGKQVADQAARRLGEQAGQIERIARWASGQTFHALLYSVYKEAPEFAARSVVRR